MTFLEIFVQKLYPGATVSRQASSELFRVSFLVDPRELAGQREECLRKIAARLRPKFSPRRKLHWGKRALTWRRP